MSIASAIVLYIIIWFMIFFIALPIRVQTQGDVGKVEPGTHAGAPQVHNIRRKMLFSTALAAVFWAIATTVILSGWVSVSDFDWTPGPATAN